MTHQKDWQYLLDFVREMIDQNPQEKDGLFEDYLEVMRMRSVDNRSYDYECMVGRGVMRSRLLGEWQNNRGRPLSQRPYRPDNSDNMKKLGF